MRTLFFLILLSVTALAHGGTLERCQAQEKSKDGMPSCIKAEYSRSANRLRELDPVVLAALNEKAQGSRHQALLRQYRAAQARHVRKRDTTCRKQAAGSERQACEADMNFAQIEQLSRFTQ